MQGRLTCIGGGNSIPLVYSAFPEGIPFGKGRSLQRGSRSRIACGQLAL